MFVVTVGTHLYTHLVDGLMQLYTQLVGSPLHTLYFRGPTMLGFWSGAAQEDICYSLTGTSAVFWIQNHAQCAQLC